MQTISVDANGMTFDGYFSGEHGNGPVLLLHGFPQAAYVWRHQLLAQANTGHFAVAQSCAYLDPDV